MTRPQRPLRAARLRLPLELLPASRWYFHLRPAVMLQEGHAGKSAPGAQRISPASPGPKQAPASLRTRAGSLTTQRTRVQARWVVPTVTVNHRPGPIIVTRLVMSCIGTTRSFSSGRIPALAAIPRPLLYHRLQLQTLQLCHLAWTNMFTFIPTTFVSSESRRPMRHCRVVAPL